MIKSGSVYIKLFLPEFSHVAYHRLWFQRAAQFLKKHSSERTTRSKNHPQGNANSAAESSYPGPFAPERDDGDENARERKS
jgi:hypothetical protein